MALLDFLKKIEPDKKKSPFLHTLYDGFFTFAYTPNSVTKDGVHLRDPMDLKRTMIQVVVALTACYIFGIWNTGHQHFVALGENLGYFQAFHLKMVYGIIKLLPIFIVTHVVGLGIEFFFAAKKGHAIEEGFLVSGALIPLIMPPDIPLLWLAFSVAFAVIIGKEAFGGTGMNIWNIALLARAFIFFAYPTTISGDEVWVAGIESTAAGSPAQYGWAVHMFDGLFEWLGWNSFPEAATVVDGYTGATPLALAASGGWESATAVYSPGQMFWGAIPGSMGETCKPLILLGAAMLLLTRIASWRIMAGMVFGGALMALFLNLWGASPFMDVPWYYQFYMGSFFFAMAFMATDPVTASSTKQGKWVYGFLIGFVGMIIRVMNPAYPEGWMLSILLINTFSALIDNSFVNQNIKKRLARA